MKKTILLCVFLAVLVIFVRGEKDNIQDMSWYSTLKCVYELSMASDEATIYALAEKAENKLCYASAKSTDKYRIMAFFEAVKNNPNDTSAKNVMCDVAHIFDSCKTIDEAEFCSQMTKIYNEHIAPVTENSKEETGTNQEKILSGGNERKNASEAEKILSVTETSSCIFSKLAGMKNVVSADGTVWMYGKNYLFVVSPEDAPMLALYDLKKTEDCLYRFKNRAVFNKNSVELFPLGGYDENSDGDKIYRVSENAELFKIMLKDSKNNYIVTEKYNGKFVFFDFSLYRSPVR